MLMLTKFGIFIGVITLLFVGFLIGYIFAAMKMVQNPDGIFFVNLNDPDDEVLKMRIDLAVEEIPNAEFLVFKVQKL